MSTIPKFRIFGLDFLRALAISLVVISHITYLLNFNESSNLVTLIRAIGAVGVDIFFVLSGFLIGGIILKRIIAGKTAFKDLLVFWKRRWLRTLPNYFLILILNTIIFYVFNEAFENRLVNYFFFTQNFNIGHPNFFTEAWSLSVEEYAYLFLPFLLYLSFYIFKIQNKIKFFFWITIVTLFTMVLLKILFFYSNNFSSYKEWSNLYRKVVIYRMDAIYIGFLLIYFMKKYSSFFKKYRHILVAVGILVFALLHLIIYAFNLKPEIHSGFYIFIYLQVLIMSIGLTFPFFYHLKYKGLFLKSIEFISIHSYSIYLVNYSLILLPLQEMFDLTSLSFIEKVGIVFMFLGLTLIFSRVLYVGFEKPILIYRDKNYLRVQSSQTF